MKFNKKITRLQQSKNNPPSPLGIDKNSSKVQRIIYTLVSQLMLETSRGCNTQRSTNISSFIRSNYKIHKPTSLPINKKKRNPGYSGHLLRCFYIRLAINLVKFIEFRGTGLLVLKYFKFFARNTKCAFVVALLEKSKYRLV